MIEKVIYKTEGEFCPLGTYAYAKCKHGSASIFPIVPYRHGWIEFCVQEK